MTNWVNDWANYQAVDKYGDLWEYEFEPIIVYGWFDSEKGRKHIVSEGNDATNWQNSLVKRDRDNENKHDNLIRENEYLRARNAELFAELERVKKVANDLAMGANKPLHNDN